MKKNLSVGLAAVFFMIYTVGMLEAAMLDTNIGELVLDDITGRVWYRDVASFTNQTYSEQLDSISLLNQFCDINDDGYADTLTWNIASHVDVNGLISNYQLDSEINRRSFMSDFSLTRFESYGNIGWDEEIIGRIGTETTYGVFKLFQSYLYGPTVAPPDYVHDPYGVGEVEVTGPFTFDPQFQLPLSWEGAWAVADVQYGSAVPIPSTVWFLLSGLIGLAGIRKND